MNLISLIHSYRRIGSDNEKITFAISCSQLLTMEGVGTSSAEEKLQFCSDAVEAIASVVAESRLKHVKTAHIASLLNRDEIDFIQDMMLNDSWNEGKNESSELDNESQMDFYGT
nr:hypothetical protein [uncultured Glaciecola sp.]